MKKIGQFFTFFVLTFFLTACGSDSETTRTFELEQGGVLSTLVYTAKGDQVIEQRTENIINYELAGFPSKEAAQEQLEPMSESFQNVEGMIHSIEYDDLQAVESMTIDYEAIDFDALANLPGMSVDESAKENGVSMEKSVEMLEEAGYVEIK